jgi:transcriptional regulator with XRE-family HTH domain
MPKSIHTAEYRVFLDLLRQVRLEAGLTQNELADRLGVTQVFVSKSERGERRIDVLELARFCAVMGSSLASFALRLEQSVQLAQASLRE